MIYDVYLQVKRTGRTHAHVPDLPGCNWLADTPEAAWDRAGECISAHIAWLRKYSQPAPTENEPVTPRLAQKHKSTAREGHLVGFFESDRDPVLPAEIPCFLDLMACARAELLSIVGDLPEETLDWKPDPGSWSVQETLRHVAGAERWYLTRILEPADIPNFKPSKSVWQRLEIVRESVLERLRGLGEPELSKVVADKSGELWSARKVFRRYLEHEREHTAHIQEILDQYEVSERYRACARRG
jgi:predicted RNase H-like HicB family nuclease/uncharacterized damage-inducible protein DinB